MSIRELPQARCPDRPKTFQWDTPSDAFSTWAESARAEASDEANTITIYDVIGQDYWSGEGVTTKRIAGALRTIGNADVTVNIDSPGGDMFEGIAIYNLLAAHKGKVNVNVIGIAASSASIIAMAGDTISMGAGAQLMIHNSWGVVVGNQNDFRTAADIFAGFDGSMAEIYEARTGMKRTEIEALMNAETFMGSSDAIRRGFADRMMAEEPSQARASSAADRNLLARRSTEAALARAGIARSERQRMISALTGAPRDASTHSAARDAGEQIQGLQALIATLKP